MTELTPRQAEVLKRIAKGETVKAIACDLGVSPKTVEYYWKELKARLKVQSYVEATHYAIAKLGVPLMFLVCLVASAQPTPKVVAVVVPTTFDASLAWDRVNQPEVAGYRVYYGNSTRTYPYSVLAGNSTNLTIPSLSVTNVWFFAATSYATNGAESDYSNEVSLPAPAKTNVVVIITLQTNSLLTGWKQDNRMVPIVLTNPTAVRGFWQLSVTQTNY